MTLASRSLELRGLKSSYCLPHFLFAAFYGNTHFYSFMDVKTFITVQGQCRKLLHGNRNCSSSHKGWIKPRRSQSERCKCVVTTLGCFWNSGPEEQSQ